jgi:hypothetical protein
MSIHAMLHSLKLLARLGFVETGRFEAAPGWGKSAAFI